MVFQPAPKFVENIMKRMFAVLIVLFVFSGCREAKKETNTLLEPTEIANISEELITEESMTLPNAAATVSNTQEPSLSSQPAAVVKEAEPAVKAASQSSGPTVKEIQQALKNSGVYQGKIDGVIGGRTKKAIEDFQMKNKLKADGKVGPKTWSKLSIYLKESPAAAGEDASQGLEE